jgi:hypothetical protein
MATMTDTDTDPPPDLATFVAEHGGAYGAITREAWAEWDQQNENWQKRRRERLERERAASPR